MQLGIEVHHLHESVDTRIGTSCAQGIDRVRREARQRPLQLILHRSARGLALPALIPLSEVTDAESQSHGTRVPGRNVNSSTKVSKEALRLGLERPGATGHDLLDQRAGTV